MLLIIIFIIICIVAIPEMGIKGFLFFAGITIAMLIGEWIWNNIKKEEKS